MVVDTCILIEHLRAKDKSSTKLFRISGEYDLYISSVVTYEVLMGAPTPEKQKEIKKLTEGMTGLPMTEEVAVKAAEIYQNLKKKNKIIGHHDILIAATCLVFELPVATSNKEHFKRVDDLKVLR
jgi:tRNA(fMet)-specific endonuclease VapC